MSLMSPQSTPTQVNQNWSWGGPDVMTQENGDNQNHPVRRAISNHNSARISLSSKVNQPFTQRLGSQSVTFMTNQDETQGMV